MKLAATLARSLQADMQAELRDIERAVAAGTRDAGRGLRTELRGEPGLHQGAPDHPCLRRGRSDPEQARALSGDPDRECAAQGNRW
jgi:hypothetical protein